MQTSRRQILQAGLTSAAAIAVTSGFPGLLSASPAADNILVIVQLSGGNDGLNTVIPFTSNEYRTARPHIAIQDQFHRISRNLALHPAMSAFKDLFDQGHLAIINGCGYPQPNRSHFRSLEIWHTADPVGSTTDGWLARYLTQGFPDSTSPKAVHLGSSLIPQALLTADQTSTAHSHTPAVGHSHTLAAQLDLATQLIAANQGTRIFYCQLAGFDTHANQLTQHHNQLAQLSESVASFYIDLAAKGYADKVTVMCFSEFGRRLDQNNSNGTDHGTAGPMFLLGSKIKGGLYGAYPSLTDLDQGDLKYTTDFRRVYATLLDKWLRVDSTRVLGNRFEPLPFLA